jgi:hypothetical protein
MLACLDFFATSKDAADQVLFCARVRFCLGVNWDFGIMDNALQFCSMLDSTIRNTPPPIGLHNNNNNIRQDLLR